MSQPHHPPPASPPAWPDDGTPPQPAERSAPALCRLAFQPRVSARSGEIVAVLASMCPTMPPTAAPGLPAALVRWALRRACQLVRHWQQRGLPPLRVVLRLPVGELHGGRLAAEVERALAEAAVPARWLGIELADLPVATDLAATLAPLAGLREAGLGVGLADAGTAPGLLSGLRSGLLDTLGLGRSLLPAADGHCEALPLLRALVAMAHERGIAVVADGVDDARQLEVLVAQGCDLLQGALLGGPGPAHALEQTLRAGLRPAALPRPLAAPVPRILVVDDDVRVLARVQRHLALRLGEAVHLDSHSDPAAALRRLRDTAYDLVICDLRMPGLDGETLLAAARLLQPEALRLMMLGASDLACVLDDPRQVDVFRYIAKPWTAEQFDTHLRAALAQLAQQRSPTPLAPIDARGRLRPAERLWSGMAVAPVLAPRDVMQEPGDELVLPSQLLTLPGDLWTPHPPALETEH